MRIDKLLSSSWILFLLADPAMAQDYPSKPVTMVVPMAVGGGSDIMGRSVAQKLGELWGQQIVVENRAGGTTTVGADHVSRANADGYTMMLAAPPFIITQFVYPNLKYTTSSFEPVSLIAYYPLVMVVNAELPIRNMKELIDYARAHPGTAYPSPGAGTTPHLVGEMIAQKENLKMVHVPYKSGGQAIVDLVAGRLHFYAGVPTEVMPNVQNGKLRAIATLAPQRSALLPDIPTSTEAGYSYVQAQSWSSIVMPKGTPRAVVDKVNADLRRVIQMPDFRDRLTAQGAVFVGSTPETLASFYQSERELYGPLVKSIGLKPD
jgi:tripartite-type tricarboxylate transporter receptor subunit TctC